MRDMQPSDLGLSVCPHCGKAPPPRYFITLNAYGLGRRGIQHRGFHVRDRAAIWLPGISKSVAYSSDEGIATRIARMLNAEPHT